MSDNRASLLAAIVALLVLGLMACCLLLPFFHQADKSTYHRPESAGGEVDNRLIVELGGDSVGLKLDAGGVLGLDGRSLQARYFSQAREGREFDYAISGLRYESFDLELFCMESQGYGPGERVFTVYADGNPLPELTGVDLAAGVGPNRAWRVMTRGVRAPEGRVDLAFKAEAGLATLSYARLLVGGRSILEFDGRESRHWVPESMPLRYTNGDGQDLSEVVLGRFGSRFSINPVPQLRGWRQSPLGTWSDDLSELVLAFRSPDGEVRCLPFTDRYPVFARMHQELTLTGVSYRCSDPELPFSVDLYLEAPFYPQDLKLSSAPFFYLELKVDNPTGEPVEGEFLFARDHRYISQEDRPSDLPDGIPGYRFAERYNFGDASYLGAGYPGEAYRFEEAVALDDPSGVSWHYDDVENAGWIWRSHSGYPLPCESKAFTYRPRGHSGFSWSFALPAGGTASRTVVLAGHSPDGVMEVMGDKGYRFIYNQPSGPALSSLQAVVEYALGPEKPAIEEKAAFFNGILAEPYLSELPRSGQGLTALALQSYIVNTWWVCNDAGSDWFSAWEGPPFYFMSTIDVEYNNAWFYQYFWPDLLAKQLRQWVFFEMEDGTGKHLPHDIGTDNRIIGMTYPIFGMQVEENADFLLLLYAYWKQAGDNALMRELYPHVTGYIDYLLACDTDGDGLPDINSDNSIDQAQPAFVSSRNQTYLGVKTAAALRAASDMSQAQEPPASEYVIASEMQLQVINQTLREKMWLGDHFAVCSDPGISPEQREAYSIYSANGLLWLLASGGQSGLDPDNLDRMRVDLAAANEATRGDFGCVHTSGGDDSQWISQNLWRDALGYYLEVEGWPEGQEGRLDDYWNLEYWWACNMNGGFWDSVFYRTTPNRVGPRRGAYECDRYLDQSLGYYSRGVTALVMAAAPARLSVDRVAGSVSASPVTVPGRYPVFACADWGAGDPAARIPVLAYGADGRLQETVNPQLLP
jgi:hypothetical protein